MPKKIRPPSPYQYTPPIAAPPYPPGPISPLSLDYINKLIKCPSSSVSFSIIIELYISHHKGWVDCTYWKPPKCSWTRQRCVWPVRNHDITLYWKLFWESQMYWHFSFPIYPCLRQTRSRNVLRKMPLTFSLLRRGLWRGSICAWSRISKQTKMKTLIKYSSLSLCTFDFLEMRVSLSSPLSFFLLLLRFFILFSFFHSVPFI